MKIGGCKLKLKMKNKLLKNYIDNITKNEKKQCHMKLVIIIFQTTTKLIIYLFTFLINRRLYIA
jgi:hypothetical protein